MRRDDVFDHPSGSECLGPLKSQKHRRAVYPLLALLWRVRSKSFRAAVWFSARRTLHKE